MPRPPPGPVTKPGAQGNVPGGGDGSTPGQPDLKSICPKLPVADAQPLVRPKLTAAVPAYDGGGCTFILPGNAPNDSNVDVNIATGSFAAGRYKDDVNGTFTVGDKTMAVGGKTSTVLSGVGDKAVWASTVGYPGVSALKGQVYCSVSTTDDGTKLTIIGSPTNPVANGTPAQQKQYAVLEGKLCSDLFAVVH